MGTTLSTRQKLIKEIKLLLGAPMRVELTEDHYDLAIDMALDRYRQRSANSVSERFTFLNIQAGKSTYTLPDEIIEVRQVLRGGAGISGVGTAFDPFGAAFTNAMLLNGSNSNTNAIDLVTYEIANQYRDIVNKMFGLFLIHHYDNVTKTLIIDRYFTANETVALWVYMYKPENVLFTDTRAKSWIRDWSVARAKLMLAEIRGKWSAIPGPQGGGTLNAADLRSDAMSEMERLENEVKTQTEQEISYGILIG